MSHHTAPTLHYRLPYLLMYDSITFTHLEENSSVVKLPYLCQNSKGNPHMVEEPSQLTQLSKIHMCKIGLIKQCIVGKV
jgi:hypothetical protein